VPENVSQVIESEKYILTVFWGLQAPLSLNGFRKYGIYRVSHAALASAPLFIELGIQ
jgi:hypothetical protein